MAARGGPGTLGATAIKENRWLDDGAYLALCIVRRAAEEGGVEGLVTAPRPLSQPPPNLCNSPLIFLVVFCAFSRWEWKLCFYICMCMV